MLGRSDYHYRHEPILYGYKPGRGAARARRGGLVRGQHQQTSVLEVPRPRASREHPTMKPPELIGVALRNSSRRGDLVLDPFAGSGSTLVACERLGRAGAADRARPALLRRDRRALRAAHRDQRARRGTADGPSEEAHPRGQRANRAGDPRRQLCARRPAARPGIARQHLLPLAGARRRARSRASTASSRGGPARRGGGRGARGRAIVRRRWRTTGAPRSPTSSAATRSAGAASRTELAARRRPDPSRARPASTSSD